jgi:hypothetical protein
LYVNNAAAPTIMLLDDPREYAIYFTSPCKGFSI